MSTTPIRPCGTCTKCCEGSLVGTALGSQFGNGKPCFFVAAGKGCTRHEERPEDPCRNYQCGWTTNLDIPEEFKPNLTNTIADLCTVEGHKYIRLVEAGSPIPFPVLTWFISYAKSKSLNLSWQVGNKSHLMGNPAFIDAITRENLLNQ
jgi:hypothetical protein